MPAARRQLSRKRGRIRPAVALLVLLAPVAACEAGIPDIGGDLPEVELPDELPELGLGEETGEGEESATGLPRSIEYEGGSAAVEYDGSRGYLQWRVDGDVTVPALVTFRGVTASPEGVDFDVLFTWNPGEQTGEIYHQQVFVASGGQRYNTGGEGVLTSYGAESYEMVIDTTVTVPDAPGSGAIFFQGPDYGEHGTGLPPIGVCYQADVGYDLESCA